MLYSSGYLPDFSLILNHIFIFDAICSLGPVQVKFLITLKIYHENPILAPKALFKRNCNPLSFALKTGRISGA